MTAGYRSSSGSWIGGISALPSITKAGYFSLLAFWVGGIGSNVIPIPPVPPVPIVIEARRWPGPPMVIYREGELSRYDRQRREEEEIIIL